MEKIRIVSFTEAGGRLCEKMAAALEADYEVWRYTTKKEVSDGGAVKRITDGLQNWCGSVFADSAALIFIGACGIAVRTVAPFLVSKATDPAVLAADERGRYVISLLSGHLGGGNALTEKVAAAIGAEAVITTASDVNGKIALDVWAKENGLVISDLTLAKRAAAVIVAGGRIPFFCEGKIRGEIPWELAYGGSGERGADRSCQIVKPQTVEIQTDGPGSCGCASKSESGESGGCGRLTETDSVCVAVSARTDWGEDTLRLIPKAVILGIGCRKGKPFSEIKRSVRRVLEEQNIAPESIYKLASIDIKAQEPGITALAEEWKVPFETFSAEELMAVEGEFSTSGFVRDMTGADNVCERSAMAALPEEERKTAVFLCRKTAEDGVTAAFLCREWSVSFE